MTRKHTNIELVSNSGFFTLVAYSLKDKYELLSKGKKEATQIVGLRGFCYYFVT
ncbi:MAG: hypothetical protein ACTTJN_09475 [Prevotella intermedia]